MSLIDDLEAAIAKYPCPPSQPINIYGSIMAVAAKWAVRVGLSKAGWLRSVADAYDRYSATERSKGRPS